MIGFFGQKRWLLIMWKIFLVSKDLHVSLLLITFSLLLVSFFLQTTWRKKVVFDDFFVVSKAMSRSSDLAASGMLASCDGSMSL